MRLLLGVSSYLAATSDKNKREHEREGSHHDEPVADAQLDDEENIPFEEWAEPVVIV